MAYRSAPPDSSVVLTCSPLLARRALVIALVSALAAAGGYAVLGLEGAVVWGPLLVLAVFLLCAGVRRSARVTLRVDARRRRLWVRSPRLLRRGVVREVDVEDAVGVAVETERSAHWLRHLPWGALLEGRIALRSRAGENHALFEPRFNPRAQAKVAERLATLLDIERDPVVGVDVPLPPVPRPTVPKWLLFVLLGVGLSGALAVTTLLALIHPELAMTAADRKERMTKGWLDLRCTSTCRFQGMTCSEGGQISGAFEAGEVVVEVADPAAPGGFRAVVVPIRVEHRTTFECLPDARTPTPVLE